MYLFSHHHTAARGAIMIMYVMFLIPLLMILQGTMNVIYQYSIVNNAMRTAESVAWHQGLVTLSQTTNRFASYKKIPKDQGSLNTLLTMNLLNLAVTDREDVSSIGFYPIAGQPCVPNELAAGCPYGVDGINSALPYDKAYRGHADFKYSLKIYGGFQQWVRGNSGFDYDASKNAAIWSYEWNRFLVIPPQIVVVADYSASMAAPYIPGKSDLPINDLRNAVNHLISNIGYIANIAFVSFRDKVTAKVDLVKNEYYTDVLKLSEMENKRDAAKKEIEKEIKKPAYSQASGDTQRGTGTDMASGIKEAKELFSSANETYPELTPQRIIILVGDGEPNYIDGDFNSERAKKATETEAKAAREAGIIVVSILVSHKDDEGHNERINFMKKLTGNPDKQFFIADSFDAIDNILSHIQVFPHCVSQEMKLSHPANNKPWMRYPAVSDLIFGYVVEDPLLNSEVGPYQIRWIDSVLYQKKGQAPGIGINDPTNVMIMSLAVKQDNFHDGDDLEGSNHYGLMYYNPNLRRMELNYTFCDKLITHTSTNKSINRKPGNLAARIRWGHPLLYRKGDITEYRKGL